jgi:hypothetical protein
MKNLTFLSLRGNTRFTDAGLEKLSQLDQLEVLWLSGDFGERLAITDEGLRHLKPLKRLYFLQITYAQLTHTGVDRFTQESQRMHFTHDWTIHSIVRGE